MEVVLLLSAERDLQEAYNWVEEHRLIPATAIAELIDQNCTK